MNVNRLIYLYIYAHRNTAHKYVEEKSKFGKIASGLNYSLSETGSWAVKILYSSKFSIMRRS